MTDFPSSPNFVKHSENLSAVTATLTQVERAHKEAIRKGDQPSEAAMRKVHTLLLGVYAESRLRKIIDDPTGFNDRERSLIWLERSQDGRWLSAVDLAARRHYGVMTHQALDDVLLAGAKARIDSVNKLLQDDLAPVITDRNRLAHGQWVWQLKSRSDDRFAVSQTDYDYNYVALRARFRLLDLIAHLVNVLCVSEPTFDRDFDSVIKKIETARESLDGSGYDTLALQLRKSRERAVSAGPTPASPIDRSAQGRVP